MISYRKPHRYKKRKPIYRNRFFWLGLLAIVFFFSIFYFLFLSGFFQVEKIIISGENKVSAEEINSAVESKLENKILFWPTKSIFLVNLAEMEKDVLASFPQLAEIEIKRNFPDGISVILIERKGLAQWFSGEQYFLLDSAGIVFEKMAETDPNLAAIEKVGQVELGEGVINPNDLNKILEIDYQMKTDLKIPVKDYLIYAEDKLTVLTQEDWEIYFNLQTDVKWQLTKLKTVLEEKIPQERRKDLQYIELRFGNFAPFKYRAP